MDKSSENTHSNNIQARLLCKKRISYFSARKREGVIVVINLQTKSELTIPFNFLSPFQQGNCLKIQRENPIFFDNPNCSPTILSDINMSSSLKFNIDKININKMVDHDQAFAKDFQVFHCREEKSEQKIKTQYSKLYAQALQNFEIDEHHPLQMNLIPKKIKILQNKSFQQYSYFSKFHRKRKERQYIYVDAKVKLKRFCISLEILFVDSISPLTHLNNFEEGKFGKVHNLTVQDKQVSIKCYQNRKKQNIFKSVTFNAVIKQYSIALLSSCLSCGPKMTNFLGFDILVFNNQIEFAMEKCLPITKFTQYNSREILQNMATLHKYQIVHMDINPSNVMFSPTFKKLVFIDYGFSEVISQKPGEKTLTTFRGTPHFISEEMMKLFASQHQRQYVDLYYNDLYGVQTSIKQLEECFCEKNQEKNAIKSSIIQYQKQKMRSILDNISSNVFQDRENSIKEPSSQYLLIVFNYFATHDFQKIKPILMTKQKILLSNLYLQNVLQIIGNQLPSLKVEDFVLKQLYYLYEKEEFQILLKKLQTKKKYNIFRKKMKYCFLSVLLQRSFPNHMEYIDSKMLKRLNQSLQQAAIESLQQEQFFNLSENKIFYFSILIDCIRFSGQTESQKISMQISNKCCSFLKIEFENDEDPLFSMKTLFKYLLSFWLQIRTQKQKDSNLHLFESIPDQDIWFSQSLKTLISQCLLMDINIVDELNQLQRIWTTKQLPFDEHFDLLYQYFVYDCYLSLRYLYKDMDIAKKIKTLIKSGLRKLEQTIVQKYIESQDQLEYQMAKIIDFLMDFKYYFEKFDKAILNINLPMNSSSFESKLKKMIFHSQIINSNRNFDRGQNENIIEKIKVQLSQGKEQYYSTCIEKFYWESIFRNSEKFFYKNVVQILRDLEYLRPTSLMQTKQINLCLIENPSSFEIIGPSLIKSCFQDQNVEVYGYTLLNAFRQFLKQNKHRIVFQECFRYFLSFLKMDIEQLTSYKLGKKNKYKYKFKTFDLIPYFTELGFKYLSHQSQVFTLLIDLMEEGRWKVLNRNSLQNQLTMEENIFLFRYTKYSWMRSPCETDFLKQSYENIRSQICFCSNSEIPQRQLQDKINIVQNTLFQISDILKLENSQDIEVNRYVKQMYNIVIWKWKFLKQKSQLQLYLSNSFYIQRFIVAVMERKEDYKRIIFSFLHDLVVQIGKYPYQFYFLVFYEILTWLFQIDNFFFKLKTLQQNKNFRNIEWNNRYALVFYAFSICLQSTEQQKIKIFISIVKHISVHKITSQSFIVSYSFFELLHLNIKPFNKKRKKRSILFQCIKDSNRVKNTACTRILQISGPKLKRSIKLRKRTDNSFKKKLINKLDALTENKDK